MCWRLYWMDSTNRYIAGLDKWVKFPEKTLLKKEGKTVFHCTVTLSWGLLILVKNSHKKQKDRCALARCYQHSQASWCVQGRIYRFSIPCSCLGRQKKTHHLMDQELLLYINAIFKAPGSHRGGIMHVVQLRAGVPPSILSGHGCSRQHKPDSSLSPWALPGASEQKVIRAGWECPLWKHMERETLKHFPSFRKNWKWKRHPTQAQGRHIHRSCHISLKK